MTECKCTFFKWSQGSQLQYSVLLHNAAHIVSFSCRATSFFGWDWMYNSAQWGECCDFWGRLDQIKRSQPRPRERVAHCHLLVCVSIVTYSSLPFVFSPLPFVCLLRLLCIWPAIDKTQSLTMLGARCKIGGNGASTLWWICVCLGFGIEMVCSSRHCLSTFPFPDGTRQKEFSSWQPQSFLSLSLSLIHPFLMLSCGSLWTVDLVSGPEHAAWGHANTARKADWELRGSPWK